MYRRGDRVGSLVSYNCLSLVAIVLPLPTSYMYTSALPVCEQHSTFIVPGTLVRLVPSLPSTGSDLLARQFKRVCAPQEHGACVKTDET
jgi:hypothetical protein